MIAANADFAGLVARLKQRAARIGKARAIETASAGDPRRWRSASLLWPLFGME